MSISVLVVDDSEFARKILIKSLKAIDGLGELSITQAGNGKEALQNLEEELPDLMFLDLTMPVMDGYQLLSAIGKMKWHVPTIVVSADVQNEAVKRVKEMGVLGFLTKTIDKDKIAEILREIKLL